MEEPDHRSIVAAFVLLAVVALVDLTTGYEYGFSFFYLLPILLAGWRGNLRWSCVLAATAAATWFIVDRLEAPHFKSPAAPFWNAGVRAGIFLVTALLIARLRRETDLARTDALTGLVNRRAFVEASEREIARARRYRHPFSVLYLDADGFKRLNDTRGHRAGNEALCATGAALRTALRDTDLPARLGGDEFAVLLPETDADEAAALVERVQAALDRGLEQAGFALSFSIGVASFRESPESAQSMLAAADQAMYEAKRLRKASKPRAPR